jgi:hypothetical protein
VERNDFKLTCYRPQNALFVASWSVSEATIILGVTTAPLVSFLHADAKVWTEVNQQRQKIGLRTLN